MECLALKNHSSHMFCCHYRLYQLKSTGSQTDLTVKLSNAGHTRVKICYCIICLPPQIPWENFLAYCSAAAFCSCLELDQAPANFHVSLSVKCLVALIRLKSIWLHLEAFLSASIDKSLKTENRLRGTASGIPLLKQRIHIKMFSVSFVNYPETSCGHCVVSKHADTS